MDAFIYEEDLFILFILFGIINSIIPIEKRIHADRLLHCFILSTLYLLYCLLVYQFALGFVRSLFVLDARMYVFYSLKVTSCLECNTF